METKKITTSNYEDYKRYLYFFKCNSKYEIVSEEFTFNEGKSEMGWTLIPKYSDKQIIKYKRVA